MDANISAQSLVGYLEGYLRQEGLYGVIPEYRRTKLFGGGLATLYLVTLWAISGGQLFVRGEPIAALLLPPALLLVSIAALVLWAVVKIVRDHSYEPTAEFIGGFILTALPIALIVGVALYLESWTALWQTTALTVLILTAVVLGQHQSYRIYSLWSVIRLTTRMVVQSVRLVTVLMPLLLTFVLFSLFSQEVWQVLAALPYRVIPVVLALIAAPGAVFWMLAIRAETRQLAQQPLPEGSLTQSLSAIPFISKKLSSGLISEEEVRDAADQILWRDYSRLSADVIPTVRARLRLLLFVLSFNMAVVLLVLFAVYFFVLFSTLFSPSLLSTWTGVTAEPVELRYSIFGTLWQHRIPATSLVTAKVSVLLATIITTIAIIYPWTDSSIRERYDAWLRPLVLTWITVGLAYRSLIMKDVQVWEYRVRDSKRSLANVDILIPPNVADAEIERLCQNVREWHSTFRLVLVQACRKTEDYDGRWSGRERWHLVDNRNNDLYSFDHIPAFDSGFRGAHFLGRELWEHDDAIPWEWFGETEDTATIGRAIWEQDREHTLVLHPYVHKAGDMLVINLRLLKRLTTGESYKQLTISVLNLLFQRVQPGAISISAYYRDTLDSLVDLTWNAELNMVSYSDEHTESGFSDLENWQRALNRTSG